MKRVCHIIAATVLFAVFACDGIYAQSKKGSRKQNKTAQKDTAPETIAHTNFHDEVFSRFTEFYDRGAQEKLYLHTDKPYYCAGENIWFKGYLVDALTLKPSMLSGVIYVELIDDAQNIVKSIHIGADSLGMFHNRIELEADLPAGDYILRAYTRWMTNEDPRLMFTKEIRIENPIDTRVINTVAYTKNDDGTMTMTASFTTGDLTPIANVPVQYTVKYDGMKTVQSTLRTDEKGEIRISLKPAADSLQGKVSMEVQRANTDKYIKETSLPSFSDDFDIQFLPEGGVLVAGYLQYVAFKAVGSNGLSVDVSGIFYEDDRPITDFASEHRGMGRIGIVPAPGRSYRAEVTGPHGIKKNVVIPVAGSGCPLQVLQDTDNVICTILPTPDIDPGRLALVVHSTGELVASEEFPGSGSRIILPQELLSPGITQISVVEKSSGKPLSQRLVYVKDYDPLNINVYDDLETAGPRKVVTLTVNITDTFGKPMEGDFSLAVTDASVVNHDKDQTDIRSYLGLASDLKGYVEDPGYYFDMENPDTDAHLDLLMLTHGWSRFDISDILAGNIKPYQVAAETSPTISGEVKGAFSSKLKDGGLVIVDQYDEFSLIHPLEENSRFVIEGVNVRDSAWVAVQVLNKRGGVVGLTLNIDEYPVPELKYRKIRHSYRENPYVVPSEYVYQSETRYYNEGGERVVDIETIEVRHKNIVEYVPDAALAGEELEKIKSMTLRQGLTRLGLTIIGTGIEWRHVLNSQLSKPMDHNEREPIVPYIIFDDKIEYDPALDPLAQESQLLSLFGIFMEDIDGIELISGPRAKILVSQVTGSWPRDMSQKNFCVILIRSKSGLGIKKETPPSMAILTGIGCKSPVEFYQPKYNVPENIENKNPDMRTTLAWVPDIMTDADGNAEIFFYTADKIADYNIDLQGMTYDGRPCVYRTTLKRNK